MQRKMSDRVLDLRDFLDERFPDSLPHAQTVEDLYLSYIKLSVEHDHLKSIIDNTYPSSEGYMRAKGWIREKA